MLTDKIRVVQAAEANDPEDYFSSAMGLIFTDDTQNNHGHSGATIVYTSERFGEITLSLADPSGEDERRLFAHYLWNAGIYVAELISADLAWSVRGETVLELGSGLGLGGIISLLAGAKEVVMTDYTAPEIIENLEQNVERNLSPRGLPLPSVQGHIWGELNTTFAISNKAHYTRIIAADCLWMPWEHRNLARSMLHFLSNDLSSMVYLVAGFHTGRAKLATFFPVAKEEGLVVESIYEVDIGGKTRSWAEKRDPTIESVTERKRWLVVTTLMRADR